jgi:hypothetical protein
VLVDPETRRVPIRGSRDVFGDGDPAAWGNAGVVLSQDGLPSAGVWWVRDVEPRAG